MRNRFIPMYGHPRYDRNPDQLNLRLVHAEALSFVTHNLQLGYHPECLEADLYAHYYTSRKNGYDYYFAGFGVKLLRNMMANQCFAGLCSVAEYHRIEASEREWAEYQIMMRERFRSQEVARYAMDAQMEREISRARALNREAEEELHQLREAGRRQVEEQYRANQRALEQIMMNLQHEKNMAQAQVRSMQNEMMFEDAVRRACSRSRAPDGFRNQAGRARSHGRQDYRSNAGRTDTTRTTDNRSPISGRCYTISDVSSNRSRSRGHSRPPQKLIDNRAYNSTYTPRATSTCRATDGHGSSHRGRSRVSSHHGRDYREKSRGRGRSKSRGPSRERGRSSYRQPSAHRGNYENRNASQNRVSSWVNQTDPGYESVTPSDSISNVTSNPARHRSRARSIHRGYDGQSGSHHGRHSRSKSRQGQGERSSRHYPPDSFNMSSMRGALSNASNSSSRSHRSNSTIRGYISSHDATHGSNTGSYRSTGNTGGSSNSSSNCTIFHDHDHPLAQCGFSEMPTGNFTPINRKVSFSGRTDDRNRDRSKSRGPANNGRSGRSTSTIRPRDNQSSSTTSRGSSSQTPSSFLGNSREQHPSQRFNDYPPSAMRSQANTYMRNAMNENNRQRDGSGW